MHEGAKPKPRMFRTTITLTYDLEGDSHSDVTQFSERAAVHAEDALRKDLGALSGEDNDIDRLVEVEECDE